MYDTCHIFRKSVILNELKCTRLDTKQIIQVPLTTAPQRKTRFYFRGTVTYTRNCRTWFEQTRLVFVTVTASFYHVRISDANDSVRLLSHFANPVLVKTILYFDRQLAPSVKICQLKDKTLLYVIFIRTWKFK
jgi:hypothetical protein